MASPRDIRRRIRSVTNTAQITKAMQMVASSKMGRAQQAAVQGRPFARLAVDLIHRVAADDEEYVHPLMEVRPVHHRALIVVGTDKGLCGALNANLLREAAKADPATAFIAVGKKAAQYAARARRKLLAEFTVHDTPGYADCRAVSRFAQELFLKGEVDQVDILFTRFVNTLTQRPDTRVLLPMGRPEPVPEAKAAAAGPAASVDYLYEPDAPALLDRLLGYLLDFELGQVLLEAKASEHSARMVAMKNATDNAQQLIKDLTLEYNKMRQAGITKELLEISSAAMALG